MNYKLFIIYLLLTFASCKKRQYCLYRRLDLQYQYVLTHSSKPSIVYLLIYNYSNPYNVHLDDMSKKQLDSLTQKEGYKIDTILSKGSTGYSYEIDGNCQYCDYYKSLYPYNVCEPREE